MIFSFATQMTMGSSFGVTAVRPPPIPVQDSASSASLLQCTMPGSPALNHAKTQSLSSAPGSPLFRSLSPCHPSLHASPARATDISLSDVHVPLEAIRPSKRRIILHFSCHVDCKLYFEKFESMILIEVQ